jgi:isopenicillin N synthase-like dioxygenase
VRRRSTAFFFDADWDALVTCVATCTDAEHPPRYPPVRAGEHLMAKTDGPQHAATQRSDQHRRRPRHLWLSHDELPRSARRARHQT